MSNQNQLNQEQQPVEMDLREWVQVLEEDREKALALVIFLDEEMICGIKSDYVDLDLELDVDVALAVDVERDIYLFIISIFLDKKKIGEIRSDDQDVDVDTEVALEVDYDMDRKIISIFFDKKVFLEFKDD